MKKIAFLSLLLAFFIPPNSAVANPIIGNVSHSTKSKALWATAWEINSPENIVGVVKAAYTYNFDTIFAEIRYRGDALYISNRTDSTYKNPEKMSYFVENPDNDFDPLEYLITLAHLFHIKVYGWITTFVITPKETDRLPKTHIYFQHPEWITCKYGFIPTHSGTRPMQTNEPAGAFLDPGIKEARQYTENIILDIVSNYNLDGIILDYVRYPPAGGYNKIALCNFIDDIAKGFQPTDFNYWRQKQISDFVDKTSKEIKQIKPEIKFAVTAFPDLENAKNKYFQNWKEWLSFNSVDFTYLMIYTKSDYVFEECLRDYVIPDLLGDKIAISIRAWDEKKQYSAKSLLAKIDLCYKFGIDNIAFFHFGGMKENRFFEKIDSLNYSEAAHRWQQEIK